MKKRILLLATLTILGLSATTRAQNLPAYIPSNGLMAWWSFDGNTDDLSGNANHGINYGAALTADRFGAPNKAYLFDGANSYIDVPSSPSLESPTTALTVQAWVNYVGMTLAGVTPYCPIFCKSGDGGYEFMYRFVIGDNALSFYAGINNWNNNIGSLTPLTANEWYLLTIVLDQDTAYSYMNDSLVTAVPFVTNITVNTKPLQIGRDTPGAIEYFNGTIDEIGIWNRALSYCEVRDVYNASVGNCCTAAVSVQPTNQIAEMNSNAQFIAGSSDPNSTYQWQSEQGGIFVNLTDGNQYSGTGNDTLTISNSSMNNNGQVFRCIIGSGACSDTTVSATLTVISNVGTGDIDLSNRIILYPNPASNSIHIKSNLQNAGTTYSIYDGLGRIVLTGCLNAVNTSISLDALPNGIYVFYSGDSTKQIIRFLKTIQ